MAYSRDEFILKEGVIEYGTWTSPHLLDGSTDPSTSFTATDNVGYIRQGTISLMINNTWGEYLSGTPQKIIREDLIRRNYFWEFTMNQFNPDFLSIFKNLKTIF